jgi:predicted TPR repeat methyltransferase
MQHKISDLFEAALEAHQTGQLTLAQNLYEELLTLEPNHPIANNNLGNLFYKQANWLKAREHYIKAVHAEPGYVAAHLNLGLVLLKQQEWEAAIKQFSNVIALQPDLALAHWHLATLYLQQNALIQATEHYQALLELDPQHAEALNNLGVICLKNHQLEQAIEYFKQALVADTHHKDARNNLAGTLLQQDRFADAAWHFQLFLQLVPEDSHANYNMGVALMALGQLEAAIKYFQQTLQLNPQHSDALCNLGAIYLKLDNHKQAIEHYQRALAVQPDNPNIIYMLSALTGNQTPTAAPAEYIKNLFDNYAGHFDQHLTETLHYTTPQLLRELIAPFLPNKNPQWKILDLGCGTGLSGENFHDLAIQLIGVDLSPRMLIKAQEKNIYTELIEDNIIDALQRQSEQYDLVLSIDTLVYFGELNNIFEQVKNVLTKKGLFAFSIETSDTENYVLTATGRYQHSSDYIAKLAQQYQLAILASKNISGRQQENKPVSGCLFILQQIS